MSAGVHTADASKIGINPTNLRFASGRGSRIHTQVVLDNIIGRHIQRNCVIEESGRLELV